MLANMAKVVAAAVVVSAASMAAPAEAQAPTERFGVFSVQNDTGNLTITFQVKIGDGGWTTYTLAPGQRWVFWHEYKNQNDHTSPVTLIRFNSAVAGNPGFDLEYTLTRYAAPDRTYQYAKKYAFQKDSPNYYDLHSIN
jgi:hypothetical protein